MFEEWKMTWIFVPLEDSSNKIEGERNWRWWWNVCYDNYWHLPSSFIFFVWYFLKRKYWHFFISVKKNHEYSKGDAGKKLTLI